MKNIHILSNKRQGVKTLSKSYVIGSGLTGTELANKFEEKR